MSRPSFRCWPLVASIIALVGLTAGAALPSPAAVRSFAASGVRVAASVPADTRLGINVDDLAQSGSVVFTDAMKQASPWSSDSALSVDGDGNVKSLSAGQAAQTVIYPFAVYPSGDYTLLYDGSGSIAVDPNSGSMTGGAGGRAVVHVVARPGYGIRLRLTATDPKNYVRNIRLIVPGFASSYQSVPFAPAFLARVSSLNVLRFVHWSHGDTSASPLSWQLRPSVTQFTQAGPAGAAWEYQIALANAVGADPWFVVPAGATNFYITQLAALVHARLDPRLHPMFEYADGAWRAGAATNAYAMMAGHNFHLAADGQAAALAWYARRSSQMYALVGDVFGADAGRLVRVLGGGAATPGSAAEAVDRAILATAGQGADVFAIDATTAAPAAIGFTRSLLSGTRLELVASGGAVGFSSEAAIAPSTRAALDAWRAAGGGLFAASSVNGYLAAAGLLTNLPVAVEAGVNAARDGVLAAYAQAFPAAHAAARPLAAPSVLAPITYPNTYIPAQRSTASLRRAAAAGTEVLAIDAGGPATSPFSADAFYAPAGTYTYATSTAVSTAGVTNPAPAAVYQSQRTAVAGAPITYTLPGLTAGTAYTVRLHFAELFFNAAGQRVFNVSINGTSALSSFDIFAAAGGRYNAVVKNVSATANSSGQIIISLTPVTNNPVINGIEVQTSGGVVPTPAPTTTPTATPTTTPTATPTVSGADVLTVDAGGPAAGGFAADEFYTSAGTYAYTTTAAVVTAGVTNPAPEAVYQSQRTAVTGSSLTYTLPGLTAGASYGVRLHFAELFFGAAGDRVFNVSINGASALASFDIFAAAGGQNKAVVESFSATANPAGQIIVVLTSVTNNPVINGIEVQTGGSGGPTPAPTATPTVAPTSAPGSPADVTTYHNDTLRTGWNSTETILNTTNVASSAFGLRSILSVDGVVMAQPLFVANYPVNGSNHNVLIIATEHNSVYAFDADSGATLWHTLLGPSQSSADVGCTDIQPEYGISSTPVINRSTGLIYVVFNTEPSPDVFVSNLGALNLGTGSTALAPVQITASAVQSNGATISLSPARQQNRASLLLANNSLYLGIGSHCEFGLTTDSGWLLQYSASSLAQTAAFNTIEDAVGGNGAAELGSIWGSGFGPAADAQGNIYTVTGNGAFDAGSGGHNYAMSVLKFGPNIGGGVQDWFAYANEASDSNNDMDFGASGVLLLPTQSGNYPNVLVAGGKSANLYLLNRSNLGRFSPSNAGALQVLFPGGPTSLGNGLWGGPAYYDGPNGPTLFYENNESPMKAFSLTTGSGTPYLTNTGAGPGYNQYYGVTPSVSSNGAVAGTGIVWGLRGVPNGNANASMTLDAYDAANVSRRLFEAPAGVWTHTDPNTFIAPLVANGKVYAGGYKTVYVFGLAP